MENTLHRCYVYYFVGSFILSTYNAFIWLDTHPVFIEYSVIQNLTTVESIWYNPQYILIKGVQ